MLSLWKVPSLRLLGFLSHPPRHGHGCGRVDLRRNPRTTRGSSHSLSRLISIRLAGWAFQVMLTASALPLMIDFRNVRSPPELARSSGRCCCDSHAASSSPCNMITLITVNSSNFSLRISPSIRPCVSSLCCASSRTHRCSVSTRPHAACLAASSNQLALPGRDSPSVVVPLRLIDAKRATCSCVPPGPSGQPSHGPKPHRVVSIASPSSNTRSEVMVFAASHSCSPRPLAPGTQRVAFNSTVNALDSSFLNNSSRPT